MLGAGASESLWSEAVHTATYLHNVLPTKGRDKTPWELFHGQVPNLKHLRV